MLGATAPALARIAAVIHGFSKMYRTQLAPATDTVRIHALAVKPKAKPSTPAVIVTVMEAGSSIQPRSTGAKPIAGTAAIRITNTPATA